MDFVDSGCDFGERQPWKRKERINNWINRQGFLNIVDHEFAR